MIRIGYYVSRQELEHLGLADSYTIDTFSSDYDEDLDEFGIILVGRPGELQPRAFASKDYSPT